MSQLIPRFIADSLAQYPCLLHVALTLTAMHDRHLILQGHMRRTPSECFHWATALRLFNYELSQDLQTCNRDALWMTAGTMSWVALFAVETDDPEHVWPLCPASTSDLDWLEMQKGLRALWSMFGNHRQNSMFQLNKFHKHQRCLGLPPPQPGIEGIASAFVKLYDLNSSSNATNNPYHSAVRLLSTLFGETSEFEGSFRYLAFANTMEPEFEALLKNRDPRALLLMAIWYSMVEPAALWWMSARASLTRRAIWTFLDRHCANDASIQAFLEELAIADTGSDSLEIGQLLLRNLTTNLRTC